MFFLLEEGFEGESKKGFLHNKFPLPHIKRESLKGRSPFKTYSFPSLTREGNKGGRLLREYKGDRVQYEVYQTTSCWK
jgi:hypothetical protein